MSQAQQIPDFRPGYGNCHEVSDLCPIEFTIYGSYFNLGGNIFFAIFFGLCLIAHVYLGVWLKVWSFSTWVILGAVFETMGYICRSAMVYYPWNLGLLSVQICGLLWGPTFACASISILCKYIIEYCGKKYSILPYWLVPWIFIGTDIFTVILQGSGGIIASVATGENGGNLGKIGEDMIIAGVCFQVAHMVVCGGIMGIFWYRLKKDSQGAASHATPPSRSTYEAEKYADSSVGRKFHWFLIGMVVAYVAILIRCIYRVPEMAGGWANPIQRDETSFFVLDSVMISIAIALLAVFHPGLWFTVFQKTKNGGSEDLERSKVHVTHQDDKVEAESSGSE